MIDQLSHKIRFRGVLFHLERVFGIIRAGLNLVVGNFILRRMRGLWFVSLLRADVAGRLPPHRRDDDDESKKAQFAREHF